MTFRSNGGVFMHADFYQAFTNPSNVPWAAPLHRRRRTPGLDGGSYASLRRRLGLRTCCRAGNRRHR